MKRARTRSWALALAGLLAGCTLNPVGEDPGITNESRGSDTPPAGPLAQLEDESGDPSSGAPPPGAPQPNGGSVSTIDPDSSPVAPQAPPAASGAVGSPEDTVVAVEPGPFPDEPLAPATPEAPLGGNVPDEDGGPRDGGITPFAGDGGTFSQEAEAGAADAGAP